MEESLNLSNASETSPHPPSSDTSTQTIHVGTRRSALAVVQAEYIIDLLKKQWPQHEYKIHAISTMGDKNQVTALHEFNAKALWTHELEAMLVEGEVDFIVHCLKDIPTQLPTSLTLGAIPPREDPRDAFCLSPRLPPNTTLRSLAPNSIIGTSSVRRSAQLARLFPHLKFESVRGNIGTRLAKLDSEDGIQYSALILAAAGLLRMGWGNRINSYLSSKNLDGGESIAETPAADSSEGWGMLYAVGQGALALEMRAGDERIAALVAPLNDRRTALACLAERSLLRTLEGGCSVPIGVETEWLSDSGAEVSNGTTDAGSFKGGMLTVRATVVSIDGSAAARTETTESVTSEEEADEFGRTVAQLLVDRGADKILKSITLNRAVIGEGSGA